MKNTKLYFAYVAILLTLVTSSVAQEIRYGIGFESSFDNREFSSIEELRFRSGTDFTVQLSPRISAHFDGGHFLSFGADMQQPIGGDNESFFGDIAPVLYYGYDDDRWSASMGLFERSRMMIDSYSTAFYRRDYLFDDGVVGGVMGRYSLDDSFVEFVCDWEGQPSATQRERFRLLSAGQYYWSNVYVGYNLSITHFAGMDGGEFSNVVDNVLGNPCVGILLDVNELDIDLRLGALQSLQRDRSYGNNWMAPRMGEIAAKFSYKGFSFDEAFYFGENLMPLYGGHTLSDGTKMEYGELLYTGDPLFSTEGGFYNRAALRYENSFCNDRLSLGVEFATHATSSGLGTEQIIELSFNFDGALYTKRKGE